MCTYTKSAYLANQAYTAYPYGDFVWRFFFLVVYLAGEPFIDGKAVPYDPKYHAEWMKNQAEAAKKKKDENPESEKPKVSQRRHLLNRDIPSKDPPKNGAPNTGGMPENSELNMEGMSQNSESNIGEMPLNPADGGNAAEDEGMEQNDMGGMPANNMGGVAQN